jgi:hypothetical protein
LQRIPEDVREKRCTRTREALHNRRLRKNTRIIAALKNRGNVKKRARLTRAEHQHTAFAVHLHIKMLEKIEAQKA